VGGCIFPSILKIYEQQPGGRCLTEHVRIMVFPNWGPWTNWAHRLNCVAAGIFYLIKDKFYHFFMF